jgi:phosphatidylserine/phosphatidylglycerophosphate/cardiolipin synthase-like enzyme
VAAIVGSINLAPGSFDSRRELAIEVRDSDVVERLHKIAKQDWENSHPLDLSDEGLLADLEDREEALEEKLAIAVPAKRKKAKDGKEKKKDGKKDKKKGKGGKPKDAKKAGKAGKKSGKKNKK